jgi:hypothetical protein
LNATAYCDPKPKTGRGPKPKKGEKAKVVSLSETKSSEFKSESVVMYGKVGQARYYCVDLLWGKGLYQKLRFVLAVIGNTKTILVSTDLTLDPIQIIELYCYRFKIECAFRELKQVVAGFGYRFWSKCMPKLNKYIKNEDNQTNLENITDETSRRNIKLTVGAIERFALLGCIALGLLQMISLLFADTFSGASVRFMRTKSKTVPSEATVADFMRKNIYQLFHFLPNLDITRSISDHLIRVTDATLLGA